VVVRGIDVAVDLLRRRLRERVEAGELLSDRHDDAIGERREREDAQNPDEAEEAKLADPAPGPARNRRLGAFSA
jgi:hypothetical protein